MISEQMLSFIRQQQAAGVTREDITKSLLATGWQAQDIEENFASLSQSPSPTPAPTTQSVPTISTNTSGQGASAVVPPEIRGWSWGAFGLNWIWGLGNETYIALLMFIPLVNFVMLFVLGFKGNEWAWQNKRWDSVEHFKKIQRRWTIAWLILLLIPILCIIGAIFIVSLSAASARHAADQVQTTPSSVN